MITFSKLAVDLGGLHPGSVRSELILLALPAVIGQAIDPLGQLMETAYIGRLGIFISAAVSYFPLQGTGFL